MTNLPHVIINTFGGRAITSKEYYIYATMYYVDENDNVTQYDSMEIRGRGNSTWDVAKKPYRIKFHSKEKFLGKGYAKAKSWTLIANALDKTLVRNAVTFLMGDFLGLKYNPASKYVDLTLNGTYLGNYMISDQVEVRKNRVEVTEQEYPLPEDADITGGYLMEVDGFKDGNCFVTSRYQVPIRVHYPDEDEIADAQNAYIRQYMNDFESVLASDLFDDPELGYRRLVDSVSLANWFIATEVSGNIDGYYSTYFYKDRGDSLLYWGPLWDYDIAYANDNRKGDTSKSLMTDVGFGQTKMWINRMWNDPWFGALVNRRYKEVTDAGLEAYMYNKIDSLVELTTESRELNYQKWGISTRYLREYILYSSYDSYITFLKSYIKTHIAYLKTAFAAKEPEKPTPDFEADERYYYRINNANTSMALSAVNGQACTWTTSSDNQNQQWKIVAVEDGYYMIINRSNGLALNDPTTGNTTATTNIGTALNVATADASDDAQLWYFTPQGTAGYYNITNKHTQHTLNLEGGGRSNGTKVISYITDSRNGLSMNRLWYILEDEEIEEMPDEIASVEPAEYALAYNPNTKVLHFGSATPDLLTFRVSVYSVSGMLVKTFIAGEQCSVADLPSAVYIVKWNAGGAQRSTKLRL
ncbi:MAG: CotH kinase family protein [Bacteroidaceae bacterium]|nr:CotH kinase family protein [Bacteroidaceae bacterium]